MKKLVLQFLFFWLLSASAWAQVPSYISSLAPYQVGVLTSPANGKATIESVTPSEWITNDPGVLDLAGIIAAWSGGYKALGGTKMYVTGGGHSDSANNGIYVFDFAGTTNPTGWSLLDQSAVAAAIENSRLYADGRPTSIHTYDTAVYAHHNGMLYRFGGGGWDGHGRGFASYQVMKFNPSTLQWTTLPDIPFGGSFYHQTFYDSVTGKIFVITGDHGSGAFFNTATDTWGGTKNFANTSVPNSCAAYDPTRSRGISIGVNTNVLYAFTFF